MAAAVPLSLALTMAGLAAAEIGPAPTLPSGSMAQSVDPPLTAEQALANYRRMVGATGTRSLDCPKQQGEEIVVCGRHGSQQQRLPLPDERFGPGEVVRHPSEASPATDAFRGPPREPSRLGETIAKSIGLVKSLITGEDPDD